MMPGLYGLVTWNVAGWRSALSVIRKDWGSLEAFLKCLQCDILCLQVGASTSFVRHR